MNYKAMAGALCLLWACVAAAQQPVAVGSAQTRLVVYRTAGGGLSGAADLQVRGNHHAVLVDGSFSDMCVAAGDASLSVQLLPPLSQRNELSLALGGGALAIPAGGCAGRATGARAGG